MQKFRFSIDRGGTFTDVYAECPNGEVEVLKLLSEDPAYPDAPTEAIRRIMQQVLSILLYIIYHKFYLAWTLRTSPFENYPLEKLRSPWYGNPHKNKRSMYIKFFQVKKSILIAITLRSFQIHSERLTYSSIHQVLPSFDCAGYDVFCENQCLVFLMLHRYWEFDTVRQ